MTNGEKSQMFLSCMLCMQNLAGKSFKTLDASRGIQEVDLLGMWRALKTFGVQLEVDAKNDTMYAAEFTKVANYFCGRLQDPRD